VPLEHYRRGPYRHGLGAATAPGQGAQVPAAVQVVQRPGPWQARSPAASRPAAPPPARSPRPARSSRQPGGPGPRTAPPPATRQDPPDYRGQAGSAAPAGTASPRLSARLPAGGQHPHVIGVEQQPAALGDLPAGAAGRPGDEQQPQSVLVRRESGSAAQGLPLA